MITKQNICDIDKDLSEKLKNLGINASIYHLYSDEGGFIGSPKFFICKTKNDKIPWSTYHGRMDKQALHNYIMGRLCTWEIVGDGDYSKTYKIEKK